MAQFILKWRTAEKSESTIEIVGPFLDEKAAQEWGRTNQKKEGDNPCWNIFQLNENDAQERPVFPVSIVEPY